METIDLNPTTDYGYIVDEDEHLIPEIVKGDLTPEDFPLPCMRSCVKKKKLPCTSSSIHLHIRRTFLKCYPWLHAPFVETIDLNPTTDYGYIVDEDEHLIPEIVKGDVTPEDFPLPCMRSCVKCVKSTVCPCRVREIPCCEFRKCNSSVECKNPANGIVIYRHLSFKQLQSTNFNLILCGY